MKKQYRIFILTFFTSFIVLISIGTIFMMMPDKNDKKDHSSLLSDTYLPKAQDNLSVLLIGRDRSENNALFFTLLRFDAQHAVLSLAGIPPQTQISVGLQNDTLNRYFQRGGAIDAVRAVKQALRVSVDRYALLDENSLITLADSLQGVEFNLQSDIINESVNIRKGYQLLDGKRFKDIVLFDAEYQLDLELAKELIEQRITPQLIENADTLFTKITGSMETNISFYDFESRKPALRHWIQNYSSRTEIYTFNGQYSDEDTFLLSEDSVTRYRQTIYHLAGTESE